MKHRHKKQIKVIFDLYSIHANGIFGDMFTETMAQKSKATAVKESFNVGGFKSPPLEVSGCFAF